MEPTSRQMMVGDRTLKAEPTQQEITVDVASLRQERGVYENVSIRFQETLQAKGYEQVTEFEDGIRYPSVDEWIDQQLESGGLTRFYPCFVRQAVTGEVVFCKARIADHLDFGGIENEIRNMQALQAEFDLPKLIEHIPESAGSSQLELLIMEAIKLSEGSILSADRWTPGIAAEATKRLQQLEAKPMTLFPELPQQPEVLVDTVYEQSRAYMAADYLAFVDELRQRYQPRAEPVFVHGDPWVRNLITGHDLDHPKVSLVDWERSGAGYRGQDVARLLWGLWDNAEAGASIIEQYTQTTSSSNVEQQTTQLQFGVAFESLRWIADRAEQLRAGVDQQNEQRLLSEIEQVQAKAKKLLAAIGIQQ